MSRLKKIGRVVLNFLIRNLSTIIRVSIVFGVLAAAGLVSYTLISNPAKTEKTDEARSSLPLVETQAVTLGDYPIEIEVLGQVVPARETILKTQVSGEVVAVADEFIPGGFFQEGDELLKIDPADFELNVRMQKASVAQMEAALRLEKGQQATAKEELEILRRSTGKKLKSTDLALRKPQLEQAKADLESAEAELAQAELDLARTVLTAPYNAVLTARETNLGNIVNTQDTLGMLVSTDEYWVEIDVPVSDLRWLKVPGSAALVGRDGREGTLLKMKGTLDTQSRLAGMLVRVPDPLSGTPLLLGDFVRVTLVGRTLKNSVRLPQSYLRGGNVVWLMREGKLAVQTVSVAHKDRNYAYITDGLQAGDQMITSNIITPVDGMDVQAIEKSADGTL